MDPLILGSMIFTLVVLLLVGGFTLLFPLTRRLAAVLEKRYLGDGAENQNPEEVAALRQAMNDLRDTVHDLREEVEQIGERQDFAEKLLQGPKSED